MRTKVSVVGAGYMGGGYAGEGFVGQEGGFDIEQAQTFHVASGPFKALGIMDGLPQHLITAAETQDAATPPDMGLEVNIPAGGPHGRQGGFRRCGRPGATCCRRCGYAPSG